MEEKIYQTQEIGSIAKPNWRVKSINNRPITKRDIDEAIKWGKKLGIKEVSKLTNTLKKREYSIEDKQRIKDYSSIYVIKLLEHCGLDIVYNGEQWRSEMYEYPVKYIDGFEFQGHIRSFDNKYYYKASCKSELKLKRPYHIEEFEFVKSHTKKAIKVPITGAYTLADWSYDEYYFKQNYEKYRDMKLAKKKGKEEFTIALAREIIQPNIKSLIEKGATYIQIDEPAAASHPEEVSLFVESFNESVRGLDAKFGVHICFSDYRKLFPEILEMKNCAQFIWEFANRDSHSTGVDSDKRYGYEILKLFREYKVDQEVGLGVLDIHTDYIESPELVRDRIIYATKILDDPSRIYCNPDCGLRTRSWKVTEQKLKNLVKGVALAKKELEI